MPIPLAVRLVDTFPFSEPYEADLLLLKLEAEDGLVDRWIIVENSYTFQGAYKGLHAADLIAGDDRFAPYRDRIQVITADRPLTPPDHGGGRDTDAFEHERWQRDLAMADVLALDDDTWVFCSDTDEHLDGRDDRRRAALDTLLTNGDTIVDIPFIRYWYDIDNRYEPILGCAAVRVGHLRAGTTVGAVRQGRNLQLPSASDADVIGFEYSSCLPTDEVMRKLDTQAHAGYSRDDLLAALRCNRRPASAAWGDRVRRTPHWFFDRVELTPWNSPASIRDDPDRLRTGIVDPAYEANRRSEHPELYGVRGVLTTAGDRVRSASTAGRRLGRRAVHKARRSVSRRSA
ncbi:hypothetical protein [Aquihabitans sp. McL0605]|uniref:hypothetical protein n=1 Tax=Aquihabitans sp. McL0605 TaxID=3415671 RepID=UPI003CE7C0C0